ASGFAYQSDVSQIAVGNPSRLVLGQSLCLTLFSFLIEMKLQFLAQLVVLAAALRPPTQLPEKRGHSPSTSTGFKSNPMARENAFHFECSLASCLRPRGVSR